MRIGELVRNTIAKDIYECHLLYCKFAILVDGYHEDEFYSYSQKAEPRCKATGIARIAALSKPVYSRIKYPIPGCLVTP